MLAQCFWHQVPPLSVASLYCVNVFLKLDPRQGSTRGPNALTRHVHTHVHTLTDANVRLYGNRNFSGRTAEQPSVMIQRPVSAIRYTPTAVGTFTTRLRFPLTGLPRSSHSNI